LGKSSVGHEGRALDARLWAGCDADPFVFNRLCEWNPMSDFRIPMSVYEKSKFWQYCILRLIFIMKRIIYLSSGIGLNQKARTAKVTK
jgi:hypothetical protein